jgi:hypothetical protein
MTGMATSASMVSAQECAVEMRPPTRAAKTPSDFTKISSSKKLF